MQKFIQKWAIISLLKDVPEGSEFYYTEFPLHLTLAGVFKIDKDGEWLTNELTRLLVGQGSFNIEADKNDMFGPNKDVVVMRIKKTPELLGLYKKIYVWLHNSGVIYNKPNYQGQGYLPHSTFNKSGILLSGESRLINSVSIVDLFPNKNGNQRKIFATIELA